MEVKLISMTPECEKIIANCARVCHESSKNKKTTDEELINFLIRKKHFTPIEHASACFEIDGISRACSHQLVRHRLASFCQRSQRYVDEENFSYIVPESINFEDISEFEDDMETIRKMYKKWNEKISNQDARFVLPNATSTHLTISANFREFRHIFNLRCDSKAQWEIRDLSIRMLKILDQFAPTVFEDQYNQFI